jgi:hypothetical protein
VEVEIDLGDRSEWIMVERNPALCELHNGDVGILYRWPNFRKKILYPCVSHIDLLSVLVQDLFLFKVRSNPRFEY